MIAEKAPELLPSSCNDPYATLAAPFVLLYRVFWLHTMHWRYRHLGVLGPGVLYVGPPFTDFTYYCI